jgi:hypothetical protein
VKDLTGSPANALYILAGFFFLCAALTVTVFKAKHGFAAAKANLTPRIDQSP